MGSSMGAVFVQRYLQEYSHEEDYVDACVAISSPWNVGKVAKNFHDNILIRRAILHEQQDILRLHLHEEHFQKVIRDRDVDVGKLRSI